MKPLSFFHFSPKRQRFFESILDKESESYAVKKLKGPSGLSGTPVTKPFIRSTPMFVFVYKKCYIPHKRMLAGTGIVKRL